MKLIAVVITYFPDVEDAIKNICQYIDHVDTLIIWENTPKADRNKYKIRLNGHEEKIIYKGTEKNEGIAYPLNRIVEYSIANGYTHLLSMDQDSYFSDFKTYKESVESYSSRKDIGIFSPNVNNTIKSNKDIEIVSEAITSGKIYKLNIFSEDLNFREDFFIDMVDNEFCYHANTKDIHTAALPNCILQQRFGNETKYKIGLYSSNYSPFRIYHIIRNFLVICKAYPNQIKNKHTLTTKIIFNRILKILILEKNKRQKLLAVYWGVHDGIYEKMSERYSSNK